MNYFYRENHFKPLLEKLLLFDTSTHVNPRSSYRYPRNKPER